MAAEYTDSDLITAYKNKQRVRTMNYRGSLLSTTAVNNETWAKKEAGSRLYLALVPFSASIKDIEVAFNAALTANRLKFKIGIAGVNQNMSSTSDQMFTPIKGDLFTRTIITTTAYYPHQAWSPGYWGKTLYELLCDEHGKPIEAFEKYSNTKYGVLYLEIVTPEDTTNPRDTYVLINYVEGAPSEAPLNKISYPKK